MFCFLTVLISLTCFFVTEGISQEERAVDNFAGVGVRAMGMGGAYVGVADDFTAVYWNPAGLVQMETREVHVGFLHNGITNDSRFNGTSSSADLSNTRFGSLGIVYPYPVYRGSLVFAAGFNRIKDFDYRLRERGAYVEDGDSLSRDNGFIHEGEMAITTIAAAIDVSPSVSLGASANLISGQDEAINEFITLNFKSLFPERRWERRVVVTEEYQPTYQITLGAMARSPTMRVGATIGTGATHEVRGEIRRPVDGDFDTIKFDDGADSTFARGKFEGTHTISLPLEFSLGGSYRPIPGVLLAAGFHIAEWTQTEYRGVDRSEVRDDLLFESQYRDANRYHFGVEWQVPTIALDLRAGYYSDPIPYLGPQDSEANEENNPKEIIKQDRKFVTLGAGLKMEETVQFNFAWNHGTFERHDGLLNQAITIDRIFVGMSYTF